MQEKTIKFLTEYREYRVWGRRWGFGSTLLEALCREKNFDVTEFLAKRDKYQCAVLLRAFGEKKIYWWLPWSKKFKDIVFDRKACRRALEYHKYSWFWRVILGLFTSILVHRQVLKWINIEYGGYMHRSNGQNDEGHLTTVQLTCNLKFVEGTLNLLGFPGLLQQLDDNLEMVRRNMKSKEEHEQFVSQINKRMLRLSVQIHPDRAIARGDSEEEIAAAQEKQTALNACRVLIKNASELFLKYTHIYFQYECYGRMKISSLSNTRTLNLLNFRFLMKLAKISNTKQEEVIANINKFLKASDNSLESFIARKSYGSSEDNFEQDVRNALYYLTSCITGCEILKKQCDEVRKQCIKDEELEEFLYGSILKISRENTEQLEQLYKLKKFAKDVLAKKVNIMVNMEEMDKYIVLPFAAYINALLICNNIPANQKLEEEDPSCWQVITQFFTTVQISMSRSQFSLSFGAKDQQEDCSKELASLISYLDTNKEGNMSKIINSITTIRYKLVQRFNSDNYKTITRESYMDESRGFAERVNSIC